MDVAERGLRFYDQEDLYRITFEKCDTGLIIFSAEGVVFSANSAACTMLGVSREEITGRRLQEVLDLRDPGGGRPDREGIWFDFSAVEETGFFILSLRGGLPRGVEVADLFLEALDATRNGGDGFGRDLWFRSAPTRRLLEFLCRVVPARRAALCAFEDGRIRVLAEARRGEVEAGRPDVSRIAALGPGDVFVERGASGVFVYAPLVGGDGAVLEVAGDAGLAGEASVSRVRAAASWFAALVGRTFEGRYLAGWSPLVERATGGILLSQEEERKNIAYEIHDYIVQRASALSRRLQAFARRRTPQSEMEERSIRRMQEIIDEMVDTSRRLIEDLRPPLLEDFGLAPALRRLVEQVRQDGLEVFYREDLDGGRLPSTVEVALFRVAQEALHNVEKHAGDTPVFVELCVGDGRARLDVRDLGRGFEDPQDGIPRGVGIPAMRERVCLAGGTFEVKSSPGEGTLVRATVPVDEGVRGGF